MGKLQRIFLLVVICGLFLSGCVVRSYRATRDRVDQDLSSGNRGYILAKAPQIEERDRKPTRSTQVIEIELRSPIKFERTPKTQTSESVQETFVEEDYGVNAGYAETDVAGVTLEFRPYTVEKNDTLQKISRKFYGTTKKWMKIYEANKNVLKDPNSIKPGQVLNIPVISGMMVEETVTAVPQKMK